MFDGMNVNIPYGKDMVPFEIDDDRVLDVVGLNEVEVGDEESTIRQAVDNPLNSPSFSEFISGTDEILFIVNDGTRPTPTARMFDILKDDIATIPNLRFLIATGTHRAATEDECLRIFGESFYGTYADRIISHDAKEHEMVDLGITNFGTPVRLNHIAFEADRIVVISSVEPHYFSGYTGGRKSIFPGVASFETTEKNHSLAMKRGAAPLALKGNPVHKDILESLELLGDKSIFSIQSVLSHDHRIYAALAGDIHESFNAAIAKANEVFTSPIEAKADIVLSAAPFPMDASLLQLQKALNNGRAGLKDDGILILSGECPEGVGEGKFYDLMKDVRDPYRVVEVTQRFYKLGYHIAYNMANMAINGGIFLVSSIPDDTVMDMFITPMPSIEFAVDRAFKIKGKDAKILILTYGSLTVPVLKP